EGDDNEEGWVDELAELSLDELKDFEASIQPAQAVIAKLRKLAFKIVNSTTKLAPAWRKICVELGLPERMIPRDVRTRWNSTYDMIKMSVEYRAAVKRMCSDADHGL
ncbi:hypothetical protein L226DRAFT_444721, partial [Lentinus tigrinus ALCF2SS1-7]